MSILSNKIFKNAKHKITSPYGKRAVISTSGGKTSSFHSGTDYGTYNEKLPQYAIAEGKVISCGKDEKYANALFVWVEYPALKVKMLHYHLDSYVVKAGQKVKEGTLLGYTGKTGKATGIHLHLGVKKLSGGDYIDPEEWAVKEYAKLLEAEAKAKADKPKEEPKPKYAKGNYIVTADILNVREKPSLTADKKTYSELTADAQKKVKKLSGEKINGYVKGVKCTVVEVSGEWGRTASGWINLKYCEVLK